MAGSTLTRDDVLRVARLARLELTEAEITLFTSQLADILAYANAVQQVDTAGVAPTSHPNVSRTMWRDDMPEPSLDRNASLSNAPDKSEDGLFRVPKVL